jgi:hypothetical protein
MEATPTQLVGRQAELGRLDRVLDEVAGGAARFTMVRGEPGIGTTTLLAEVVRRARARGFVVFEGRATELESEVPFAIWVDTLDAYLASLDVRATERLVADGLSDLAAVFPSLRGLADATPGGELSAGERFRLYHSLRELVDLHRADPASSELAAHLMRRPPQAPVLMASTSRTTRSCATSRSHPAARSWRSARSGTARGRSSPSPATSRAARSTADSTTGRR